MGFFIDYIDREDVVYENKERFLQGAILLGSTEERFLVPLSYWQAIDYEKHWRAALLRILGGEEKSCLITSMYDPSLANFIVWWPMYREDNMILIQNQILFLDRLSNEFDEKNPFQYVSNRQTINQDGAKISEWSVESSEIQDFIDQQ